MSPEPMTNDDTPATSRKLVILKDEVVVMLAYMCVLRMCCLSYIGPADISL